MAEEHPPQQPRYSVRGQAYLDGDTHAKLEELAQAFHRNHAAILSYVRQWGLSQTKGWTVQRAIARYVRLRTLP
jgi:hypothetical protein